MDPAWAAIAAVASPLALVILNGWQQRKSDRENWRRQDEVAARAAEVAKAVQESSRTLATNQRQLAAKQAEVASQADVTAELLLASNEQVAAKTAEAAELLLESNKEVAEQSAAVVGDIQTRLEQIHILVNSELSEAQRRELAATEALLERTREVLALKREQGIELTVEDGDREVELEILIAGMRRGMAAKDAATRWANAERHGEGWAVVPGRLGP